MRLIPSNIRFIPESCHSPGTARGEGRRPVTKSTDGNGILVHSSYILNLATRFVLIESLSLGA
jgi:hypothetical protein